MTDVLAEVYNSIDIKMIKSINTFKIALTKIRTNRTDTSIFDHIKISYYGSSILIKKIANIGLIENTITIQPYEKQMLLPIEKSIRESGLGLNPISIGNIIRIPAPILTEERRHALKKHIRNEGEDIKIIIRNLRREANESLKELVRKKSISEDDERRTQNRIQKLTDCKIININQMINQKEIEIMNI